MSVVTYVWGVVALGGSLLVLAAAARALAARLLPDWQGGEAMLACVALVLGWVFAGSYLLGAVGAFRPWPLLVVVDGGAVAGLLIARRRPTTEVARPDAALDHPTGLRADHEPTEDHQPGRASHDEPGDAALSADEPDRRIRRLTNAATVAGVLAAVASWLPATAHAYRYGIFEPDSTWYHGHFVIRFVQTGWLTRINAPGTEALSPYHPANLEVLDALLVLPWHRDLALPLVALASLALLLLAAWCLGNRWHRGRASLLVAALIAATPTMRLSQPGSLKNDLMATALLTTGVALFVHSERRILPAALAGAMLGLAVGTRTNLLAPVAVLLVVGLVVLLRRPRGASGLLAPLAWVGATALFGMYWYLRNWVRTGNPLPWTDIDIGPLHLSLARADQAVFSSETIWHWRHDPDLIPSAIHPGLRLGLGDWWWGWVVLAVFSIGAVALRRSPWLWGLVAAGAVGLVAYVVTPLTLVMAPSSPLAPFNVAINTRYALPAAALILLAGACAIPAPRVELGFALAAVVLIGWGVRSNLLLTGLNSDGEAADTKVALALGAGLALVALMALVVWPRLQSQPPPVRLAAVLVPAVVGAALAFPLIDRYMSRRYATPVPAYAAELWPASQDLQDARIGIATSFVPYPYAGADLSNRVAYIGVEQPGGLLRNAATCAEWVDAIRQRRLTHVALTVDPFATLPISTAKEWTLTIDGARVIEDQDRAALIELPPDPTTPAFSDCG